LDFRNFLLFFSTWAERISEKRPLWIQHLKVPLFLLVITCLAYGVLLPQMGFYWDDWPWIWLQHIDDKAGMLQIDWPFRPLAGLVLWLFSLVGGENPLFWQWINLLLRWLSGYTAYLALVAIFPHQKEKAFWAALLFLLYPGYAHQFVAVNSSRHLLPYSLYFLSLWLMARSLAEREPNRAVWRLRAGALSLQALGMLTTEYFYGLELARPLILWLMVGRRFQGKHRLRNALRAAIPYLAVFTVIVLWRFAITQLPGYSNYPIIWSESAELLASQRFQGMLFEWLRQGYVSLVLAWLKILPRSLPQYWGPLKIFAWGALSVGGGVLIGAFLALQKQSDQASSAKPLMLLGAVWLALGGLPFLVTNLSVDLGFPANRLTLPMALGASVLCVGLFEGLPIKHGARIGIMALLSGLAIGTHFQNAVAFQRDWAYQRAFFEQLRWRVPYIQPGTLILSNAIAETHSSDNSLTAALNWLYFDRANGKHLPLLMFFLETRAATYFPAMERGIAVERRYGRFLFRGNTDQALVIFFEPPACLRVVQPDLDPDNPTLSREVRQAAHLSNLATITQEKLNQANQFPIQIRTEAQAWCYAYQKADLARQFGRWEEVIGWEKRAQKWDDSPNRADERLPFLQADSFLGNWSQAVKRTKEMITINATLRPLLCRVWSELAQQTRPSPEREAALKEVSLLLQCEP
jgi:hypothetical protein